MARGPYGMQHLEPRPRVEDPDKFRKALEAAGYTYRSLAIDLDIAKSTLHNIAKGRARVAPGFAVLVEEALKVEPGSLFTPAVSTTPDSTAADSERQQQPKPDQA